MPFAGSNFVKKRVEHLGKLSLERVARYENIVKLHCTLRKLDYSIENGLVVQFSDCVGVFKGGRARNVWAAFMTMW